ncbi:MAG: hypothetical protein MUF49_03685 [Oculatellaceae cyanobacterium Prado106]|jgi:hypothetical protein|nr:hypothetical protein [Oculatellaceae cyanobacterium Prado106]
MNTDLQANVFLTILPLSCHSLSATIAAPVKAHPNGIRLPHLTIAQHPVPENELAIAPLIHKATTKTPRNPKIPGSSRIALCPASDFPDQTMK